MKQTEELSVGNNGFSPGGNEQLTDDSRLAEAMEEYQALLAAGEKPNHATFLARFPEIAGNLAECLAGLDFLHAAAPNLSAPLSGSAPLAGPDGGKPLGDFRLISELGRGGMGIVYEAEQVSLGRRVALKVLPFAATMDPQQLQRFHNEARAAAGLHHTNIVPVYGVGCERGVHYYAMPLIEGCTMAELIAREQGRWPPPAAAMAESQARSAAPSASTVPPAARATSAAPRDGAYFRRVAEWGTQAAEALDYAHSLGVVHRDVKPANLLVDTTGRLWVTDFGLAQMQSDTRLTVTGDLVGTLRYMSPEQALAKRVVIDHRTDIYSLGATLYEMLTLQPVFGGADRQELLRQIAFEEPRRPRQVSRHIPAELEVIVLKAMEKNQADRYATSQELADDLRHFLMNEPIRARRPTLVRRARKWAVRHRAIVGSAAVVLLLAVTMLAGTIGWAASDRAARRSATEQVVTQALDESASWQEKRRLPEALSAARRAAGLMAGGEADEALRGRVQARVDDLDLLARLDEARLAGTAVREGHFDGALRERRYAEVFRQGNLDVEGIPMEQAAERLRGSSVAVELAAMLDEWALLRQDLRLRKVLQPTGDASWKRLLRVARAADPDAWRTRLREAMETRDRRALVELAASNEAVNLLPPSLVAMDGALQHSRATDETVFLLAKAQRLHPDDFWINEELGLALMASKPARPGKAIPFLTAAVALRPQSPGAYVNLGCALDDMRDLYGAIAEYRKAIEIDPKFVQARSNLGRALRDKGELDGAIAECRKAIDIDPMFAGSHISLGLALRDKGNLDGAMVEYRKAIAIDPNHAVGHNNLGNVLRDKRELEGAIAEFRKAIDVAPQSSDAYNNLGNVLCDKGDMAGAIAEYRKAIAIDPMFAQAHINLGRALRDKGELDGAIAEYRKAIAIDPMFAQVHINLARALRDKGELDGAIAECRKAVEIDPKLAEAQYRLGIALHDKGDVDGAIAAYREAARLEVDSPVVQCNLGLSLRDKGQFAEALKHLRRGHELGSKVPSWPYPSEEWVKQCERLLALGEKLPALLSGKAKPADAAERIALAVLCQQPHKRLYAAAAGFYAEAFDAQPALADNLGAGNRYNAASAAALAGCGQGTYADGLDGHERARLRKQALSWLRADLTARRNLLGKNKNKPAPAVSEQMQHWLRDSDFNCVRGAEALAKLPPAERGDWQHLWEEVTALRQRAEPKEK